jgi:hypothetical protein
MTQPVPTLRPSFRNRFSTGAAASRFSVGRAAIVGLALIAVLVRPSRIAISVVVVVLLLTYFSLTSGLYLVSAQIDVNGSDVEFPTMSLFRRRVPRSNIARMFLCSVKTGWRRTPVPRVLLVDQDGRCVARTSGTFWSLDALRELATSLGLPATGDWELVLDGKTLEETHPGSTTVWDRNPDYAQVATVALLLSVSGLMYVTLRTP